MVAIRNAGISLLLLLFVAPVGIADDRTAADLLPPTTVLYAEIPQPATVLTLLDNHPLRKRIENMQGVRDAYKNKQFLQLKLAVAVVEAKLEQTWPQILESVTEGGIAIGQALQRRDPGLGLAEGGLGQVAGGAAQWRNVAALWPSSIKS